MHLLRVVKYLSNFTWLLYFIQGICTLFKYNLNGLLVLLYFWRKNCTFYSLQFCFILKNTLHFYFIFCTLNMVNGSPNVCAWCENQWSLFACIKHTHFYFSYDFHQVNVWLQKFPIKSEEAYWGSKVVFSQSKFIHYLFCFDRAISCVLYEQCTILRANKIIDENWN